jgi:hypothetical protein
LGGEKNGALPRTPENKEDSLLILMKKDWQGSLAVGFGATPRTPITINTPLAYGWCA